MCGRAFKYSSFPYLSRHACCDRFIHARRVKEDFIAFADHVGN
jgi:hypothetical protein